MDTRATILVLALLAAAGQAEAQSASVLTGAPDPQHPLLSQTFQDESDRLHDSRLTAWNRLLLLENGVVAFPQMLDLMDRARRTLYCSNMDVRYDGSGKKFFDGLAAAAGRGVDVRCIFDGLMSDPRVVRRLRSGGVKVLLFNPRLRPDGRTGRQHQKLLIGDHEALITGGMNIGNAYLLGDGTNDRYKDTDILVEGYAAAEASLRFLQLWHALDASDPDVSDELARAPQWTQPATPGAGQHGCARHLQQESDLGEDHIRAYYRRCFDVARLQILWHVNNIRPSGEVFQGLCDAAGRGVRVVLVTNSLRACVRRYGLVGYVQYYTLKTIYLPRLQGTGIELWEIDAPLHSKALTVDGVMASIGSYNFSDHSDHNLEGTIVAYDPPLVREVEEMFERDLAAARRLQ